MAKKRRKRNRGYDMMKRHLNLTDDDFAGVYGYASGDSWTGARASNSDYDQDTIFLIYQIIAPKIQEKIYDQLLGGKL